MRNNVTIYDIASALNVSPSTVSRALSGGEQVKKVTRKRILEKAQDLGYRPNLFATNLRVQRTSMIGVIVPWLTDILTASVIAGAEVITRKAGLNLIVRQSMEDCNTLKTNIENLGRGRVDGLLISAIDGNFTNSAIMNNVVVPAVVLESVRCVSKANEGSRSLFHCAYAATRQLVQKGSTRIVFVISRDATQHIEAFNGYRQALTDCQQAGFGKATEITIDSKVYHKLSFNDGDAISGYPDGIVFLNGLVSAMSMYGFGTRNDSGTVAHSNASVAADARDLSLHIPQLVAIGEFVNSLLVEFVNCNHNG